MKNSLKTGTIILISSFLISLFSNIAFAAGFLGDLAIDRKDIRFSHSNFMEGKTVRIYATASNLSDQDLLGNVKFYDNGQQIGGDQIISVFARKDDGVFIDWTPNRSGNIKISVKIFPKHPQIDNPSNNEITEEITILKDSDRDGTPDSQDVFPTDPKENKDSDKDSIGDNSEKKVGTNPNDPDTDKDGFPDNLDAFPTDPTDSQDSDNDGLGDNKEKKIGTNLNNSDSDNDGVKDGADAFPLDPNESQDSDKDGIGDNQEKKIGTDPQKTDTDNDKVPDKQDSFPVNPKEWKDTNDNGIGDNSDPDIDGDKIPNSQDKFPLNKAPIIKFSNENFTLDINSEHTFDATPSYDEDGQIVAYKWQIDNQPVQEGNAITTDFTTPGEHSVKLTVTDDSGESITNELKISVLDINIYKQLGITLIAILLALAIYFKYIMLAKKPKASSAKHIEKDKTSM